MNETRFSFNRLALVTLIVFSVFALGLLVFARLRVPPDRAINPLPVISQVPAFTLTNELGRAVTGADLRGQVWVADIIFTRCAGPCPRMTKKMSELQAAIPPGLPVKLVTLTTDPEFDQPAILKAYGTRFGADFPRWMFLTGTKLEIAKVAADGLKLSAVAKPAAERTNADDLFIHSTMFVVVDKAGRVRGVYESTGEGVNWSEVRPKLLADVQRLANEN